MDSKNKENASLVIKVVIITRRFEFPDAEKKSKTKIYPIANVSDSTPNPYIIENENLGSFWFRNIVQYIYRYETIGGILKGISTNSEYLKEGYSSDRQLEFIDNFNNFKQEFLSFCINKFNSETKIKFKTDYLTHVHELIQSNSSNTNIFIYHHWLDKQGLPDKRKEFLTCLRNDVVSIIKQHSKNAEIEINWLLHDTDVLNENYDGLLWFDGYVGKGQKKSYHPVQDERSIERQIPEALQKDNIWCFVHQREIDSYYKRIILKIEENDNSYSSAKELYKELIFDINLFHERLKLLNDLGINASELELKQVAFLLNMPFDESSPDSTNEDDKEKPVKGKIALIQSIWEGLLTESDGKYNFDPNKLSAKLPSETI